MGKHRRDGDAGRIRRALPAEVFEETPEVSAQEPREETTLHEAVVAHHARQRAKERFQLCATDLQNIANARRRGEGVFVEVRHGKEFWIMNLSGREVPVVWNPETDAVLTVLPKHALRHLHRSL